MSEQKTRGEKLSKALYEASIAHMMTDAGEALTAGDYERSQALTSMIAAGQLVQIRRALEQAEATISIQRPAAPVMAKETGSVN